MSVQEVIGLVASSKLIDDKKWKGKDTSKIREREMHIVVYYKLENKNCKG